MQDRKLRIHNESQLNSAVVEDMRGIAKRLKFTPLGISPTIYEDEKNVVAGQLRLSSLTKKRKMNLLESTCFIRRHNFAY